MAVHSVENFLQLFLSTSLCHFGRLRKKNLHIVTIGFSRGIKFFFCFFSTMFKFLSTLSSRNFFNIATVK